MKIGIMAMAACALAIGNAHADEPIKFKTYEAPWATEHRNGDRIRTQQIVIDKADATEVRLGQLAHQLYDLALDDIAATINVYTDVWAATTKIEIVNMTAAQQKRTNKAYVGQFRKRVGQPTTFDYAPGGMYTGTGDNTEMSPEWKTLQLP